MLQNVSVPYRADVLPPIHYHSSPPSLTTHPYRLFLQLFWSKLLLQSDFGECLLRRNPERWGLEENPKKRSESNLDIMLLSMKKPNVCRDRLKTDLQQLKAKEILITGHFIFPHFTRLQLVVLPSDWLIWLHASFVLGQTCFCCIQMTTLSVTQCSYAWNSERRRV